MNSDKNIHAYVPADTSEAHFTGQFLISDRTHDAGNIVCYDKYQQGEKKAITASQKVSKPSTSNRKNKLTKTPKFFHSYLLSLCMKKAL